MLGSIFVTGISTYLLRVRYLWNLPDPLTPMLIPMPMPLPMPMLMLMLMPMPMPVLLPMPMTMPMPDYVP